MAEIARSSLAGKRIVITRAAPQSEALAKVLAELGAIPVVLPLVEFGEPEDFGSLDAAIANLERFDWIIFTSGQAVRAFVARSMDLGASLHPAGSKLRIAAVGPVSAEAVRQTHLATQKVRLEFAGHAVAPARRDLVDGLGSAVVGVTADEVVAQRHVSRSGTGRVRPGSGPARSWRLSVRPLSCCGPRRRHRDACRSPPQP